MPIAPNPERGGDDEIIDDTVIPPKRRGEEDEPYDGPYTPGGQGNPRMPRWRWRPGSGQRPTGNEVWTDSVESGWNF